MELDMENKSKTVLAAWDLGVAEFNSGRFWHAHERWELGWKQLPSPEKEYVQALIQSCAVFYLILEKARFRPAFRLCRSALNKLAWVKDQGLNPKANPQLKIVGLEKVLQEIEGLSQKSSEELIKIDWKKYSARLKARLKR